MNPHSNIYRALQINPGAGIYFDSQRIYARNLEVPSGNAVGTAQGIARAYSVFATGDTNWDYARKHSTCSRLRQLPQRVGFTTNA
jgi:hypothetical protein